MELLTGQCNKDFDTWREQRYDQLIDENKTEWTYYGYSVFNELCFSMQYGVLVDFFDSVDINIEVQYFYETRKYYEYSIFNSGWIYLEDVKTREEGRKEVIKNANEIYNKKHINNIEVQHEEIKEDE